MFPFNGRAIQALKIVEASFNVSVFFDTQLYANDLADVIERGEKINNTNAVKLDSEMKRCAKGTFRLTNEELQALQPQDLMEIHSEIMKIRTVTIRTHTVQISTACRSIVMYTNNTGRMLFLNHLSLMMGMGRITDIAAMNEEKNISLEDLKQTLGIIMATRVRREWRVAPVKRSVAKLLDKFDFNPSS